MGVNSRRGCVRTEMLRSVHPSRNGSTTAPSAKCTPVSTRRRAVSKSATTSMPIDEPPRSRLHDEGPRRGDAGGGRVEGRELRVHRHARGTRDGRGRELVHPERGAGRRRPRVLDAREIERSLQRAVLARAAVAAVDHRVERERAVLAGVVGEPTGELGLQVEPRRSRRRTLGEAARLEERGNLVPVAGLGPVEANDIAARVVEHAGHLQPGQDADVMLGRGAAVADADRVHEAPGRVAGAAAHRLGSRVVIGQIILVQHRVAPLGPGPHPRDRVLPVPDLERLAVGLTGPRP